MAELTAFINRADKPKYDLMKIALVHHRFGWIHPLAMVMAERSDC
jgi:Fic family protein